MAEFNGKQGVWRTVGGRRIFIADGEDLQTAMKNSGKFKEKKEEKRTTRQVQDEYDKLSKKMQEDDYYYKIEDDKKLQELRAEYDTLVAKGDKDVNEYDYNSKQISNRKISTIKTQKALKELVEEGKAKDITTFGDDKSRELQKKHGRLEVVKVTHGTYGMNGALLRSYETGEYFVITSRNSNLFFWV